MAITTLQKKPNTEETLLDWLQLARSENVGPLTFHRLLKQYKTPSQALEHLPKLAAKGGLKRSLKVAKRDSVQEELEKTCAFGAEILTLEHPEYPPILRYVDAPPPVLTLKGNQALLQEPMFAIVGARNSSAMGKKMARSLANELGEEGWVIVSGLARGIDAAAHEASLSIGTIAVLAGGINVIYPEENTALYEKIACEGVLVAESPFNTKPQANLFPRRNRIISGLSKGTLVVEAALKSGSLITARYALEQGREVFAIPGHPLDPRARGCNQLIKNGAVLVESCEDITNELSPSAVLNLQEDNVNEDMSERPNEPSLALSRKKLHENLGITPITIDELMRECQLSSSALWVILLEMEIAGRIERVAGGKVALKEEWKSE